MALAVVVVLRVFDVGAALIGYDDANSVMLHNYSVMKKYRRL